MSHNPSYSDLSRMIIEVNNTNIEFNNKIQQLESQLADLQDKLNQSVDMSVVNHLNEQLAEAVGVIEFYGDENSWGKEETTAYQLISCFWEGDEGKKAREFLNKIKKDDN